MSARPLVFRLGWIDSAGVVQELDPTYTDDKEMMRALPSVCEARKSASLPQISVVRVYELANTAPVVILLDPSPTIEGEAPDAT